MLTLPPISARPEERRDGGGSRAHSQGGSLSSDPSNAIAQGIPDSMSILPPLTQVDPLPVIRPPSARRGVHTEDDLSTSSSQNSGTPSDVHIKVVTWNMNKTLASGPLPPEFFRIDGNGGNADIVVVGTQESGPLSAWEASVQECLSNVTSSGSGKPAYEHVATVTLWDISMTVFKHRRMRLEVLQTDTVATGVGNVLGNKGGVAVGILLENGTRVLFVNSHFAAHDDKVAERNADFQRTIRSLFGNSSGDATADYDVTIWCGDLNYRVNSNRQAADFLVREKMWEVMRANDQLQREKSKGNAFKDFLEGDLLFPPTFKFDPGTHTYDTSQKASHALFSSYR